MNSNEGTNNLKRKKLQLKLTVLFLIFAAILCLTLSTFSYFTAKNTYTSFYTEKIREIACYGAAMVDGDRIAKYLDTMKKDSYYEELQQQFNVMKKEYDLMYLFVFKANEKDFTYILEAVKKGDDLSKIGNLGQKDAYPDDYKDKLFEDIKAKRPSEHPIVEDDRYGYVTSAWAPVFDKNGNVVAVVEADLSMSKVIDALNKYIVSVIVIISVAVVLSIIILIYAVRKMVALPLKKLTESALNFASGENLNYQANDIKTGDEMETLSDAFQKMADDIKNYVENISRISAERERIQTELSVATSIQMGLIPRIFPAFPERKDVDIYALIEPAKEVGGDFYDFFMLNEEKLGIVIADVSGKGIPAALFMMISKTLLKNYALEGLTVSEILYKANNALCENNEAGMFVTAFMGILDLKTGRFNYANAGHNPPLIQRQKGGYQWLPVSRSFVLAGIENTRYTEQETVFKKGDRLLLYTDGVTEAMNGLQQLYTDKRLLEALNNMPEGIELSRIPDYIKSDVDNFAEGAEQADDITILAVSMGREI